MGQYAPVVIDEHGIPGLPEGQRLQKILVPVQQVEARDEHGDRLALATLDGNGEEERGLARPLSHHALRHELLSLQRERHRDATQRRVRRLSGGDEDRALRIDHLQVEKRAVDALEGSEIAPDFLEFARRQVRRDALGDPRHLVHGDGDVALGRGLHEPRVGVEVVHRAPQQRLLGVIRGPESDEHSRERAGACERQGQRQQEAVLEP